MDILTIIGARPQFVKAAVVSRALREIGIEEVILHTGQHFDYEMDGIFFEELGIPSPAFNLNAGGGAQGQQTGKMLEGIESFLLKLPTIPKFILVYGDTNSTLAAALVGAKMHIPIVHVEAGLRSYNRRMPEEINRVLTDQISEILFCTSEEGVQNLKIEGIHKGVFSVGDVMCVFIKEYSV
jgi:UDP-GlcNAc3NAcA epimerase